MPFPLRTYLSAPRRPMPRSSQNAKRTVTTSICFRGISLVLTKQPLPFCLSGAPSPARLLLTHTPVPEAALGGCVDPAIHSSSRKRVHCSIVYPPPTLPPVLTEHPHWGASLCSWGPPIQCSPSQLLHKGCPDGGASAFRYFSASGVGRLSGAHWSRLDSLLQSEGGSRGAGVAGPPCFSAKEPDSYMVAPDPQKHERRSCQAFLRPGPGCPDCPSCW